MSSLVRMTVGLTAGMDARRERHLHSGVTARERPGFVLPPTYIFALLIVWAPSVFLWCPKHDKEPRQRYHFQDVRWRSVILTFAFECNNSFHQLFIR